MARAGAGRHTPRDPLKIGLLEDISGDLAVLGKPKLNGSQLAATNHQVAANTATGAPDPQDLAKGISKALFTTLVGLYLAIPALTAYHVIRNRVSRLVLEVGVVSEGMMRRFRKTGEQKA